MARITTWLCLAALFGLTSQAPAAAQFRCDAPATSAWIKPPPSTEANTVVDASLVHPVIHDLTRARAMLRAHQVAPLKQSEVVGFAGPVPVVPSQQGGWLRPYLVRAVFPVPNAILDVRWSGNSLHVTANGMGCAAFSNHPIIVYLERRPKDVFVTASAAL